MLSASSRVALALTAAVQDSLLNPSHLQLPELYAAAKQTTCSESPLATSMLLQSLARVIMLRTCWSLGWMPPLRALSSTGRTTLSSQAATGVLLSDALLRTREEVTR